MHFTKNACAVAVIATLAAPMAAQADRDHHEKDFGMKVQQMLNNKSKQLFGFKHPLQASAEGSVVREPGQSADDLIELAGGLHATILTREAANKADMFSFLAQRERPDPRDLLH